MRRSPRNVAPTLIALLAVLSGPVTAQTVQQPPVVLPRIEIGASVSFTQRFDTPPGQRDWTGPGLSLAANRNLTRNVALAAEADTFSPAGHRARRRAIAHGFRLRQQPGSGAGPNRRQPADRIGRSGRRDVTPGPENWWRRRGALQAPARHGSALGSRLPHRAVRKGPP